MAAMCGIYGWIALQSQERTDPAVLERMGNMTRHRGPDDAGVYVADGVALGMRRLSIIDPAGGHQPIANEDGSLLVVCNGEIYNFRELRARLLEQGHVFCTGSDAEVILHLYEQHADDFIHHLNGMFGFALWDMRRRRLLIGRDRLGIKPLYYAERNGRLAFASEAKALLALPGMNAEIDFQALDQYLALGYVPAPYSMFAGIRKVPPATLLICENGMVVPRSYWKCPGRVDAGLDEGEAGARLMALLEHAVVSQMVSDVPLGAFLSGGIDSSCIVALMARNSNRPVKTYSIGFDAGEAGTFYNELPYARRIAGIFGTDHHEIIVRPDAAELMPRLLWHMDEPVADSAFLTTYLVAEFARRDVTVILSGVGGDELFGGYRRYLGAYYARRYRCLPSWLRRGVLQPLANSLPADRHSYFLNLLRYAKGFMQTSELDDEGRYRSYVEVFDAPWRKRLQRRSSPMEFDALGEAFRSAGTDEPVNRHIRVDMLTQLPDDLLMLTDKMTMAASLECRVPLLDHDLVDFATGLPAGYKIHGRTLKYLLKKTLGGLLPEDILHRRKRGFGAPIGAWFKNELSPLLYRALARDQVQRRGLFHWKAVEALIGDHKSNRHDHTDHLLALMNFELWCRLYLDGDSPADVTEQLKSGLAA